MRILLVTHYFPPESGAPQARLSELAREWSAAGEEVTVLTGMPNHPTGVIPDRYRRKLRVLENVDGYRVVRTWLYATPNERIIRKTLGHMSFMVSSVLLGWRRSGPADVVVVSSPTFFSIFSGWALACLKRARFVVEVRDLWPGIFIELGLLQNRVLIRFLQALELWAYRQAYLIVVVTDGFREDLVRRGVPTRKVTVIPNGADLHRFASGNGTLWRERLGVQDGETLVLYSGAHGISHALLAVADAAALLDGEGVKVAFVGEGAEKRRLEQHVRELGIANVVLRPGVPRSEMPDLIAAADVCVVPLRDVPLFSSFIPSKLFEFLAAGKPVVGALRGEPADILRRAGAVVVDPERPDLLASALRTLALDAERRAAMGVEGRAFVAENYDRSKLADSYRKVLK